MGQKLDLSLALPGVPDARDRCIQRVTELLQGKGLEQVHVIHEDGRARLCLHYDPDRWSVNEVRRLVHAAGADIGGRYRHESLRIDGMDCQTCAAVIEHALGRVDGVLEASVSYAAERLRLEYDGAKTSRPSILRVIGTLGYTVIEASPSAGSPSTGSSWSAPARDCSC